MQQKPEQVQQGLQQSLSTLTLKYYQLTQEIRKVEDDIKGVTNALQGFEIGKQVVEPKEESE